MESEDIIKKLGIQIVREAEDCRSNCFLFDDAVNLLMRDKYMGLENWWHDNDQLAE
jgi:hypothetical protein